jgi:hypothetical protein
MDSNIQIYITITKRWCLNLILRAIDKTVMCESTIDAEDLIEVK